jgi:folate-binding protein YgfZ
MPTVHLQERALIAIEGADAESFLQNIVTTDLGALPNNEARAGALLSPQGKILFDFLVSRTGGNAFRLECRAGLADDFVRRLTMYRLRAKATIAKQDQSVVAVSWGSESSMSQTESTASQTESTAFRDSRFVGRTVLRHYAGQPAADASDAEWQALRIASGVAESGLDYAVGDAFPHDVLLDENGGVGFRKGCYIGQEVVSRMQHRGTARRRVLIASGATALPVPGTEILVNGRPAGTLGTVNGNSGLAIARIDRVKDAVDAGHPITAGGVPVTLGIPPFAKFAFPRETAGAEDA